MKQPKARKIQKYPEFWMHINGGISIKYPESSGEFFDDAKMEWAKSFIYRYQFLKQPKSWIFIGEIKP